MWGSAAPFERFKSVQIEKDLEVPAFFQKSPPVTSIPDGAAACKEQPVPGPERAEDTRQQSLVPCQRKTNCSSGPWEQPGKQISPILGHAYTFNNKLSLSSPAFSFLSLPNPAGLHPR